jgi:hypothetical protein
MLSVQGPSGDLGISFHTDSLPSSTMASDSTTEELHKDGSIFIAQAITGSLSFYP